jgi:LCP family protein required for cell wall assembly
VVGALVVLVAITIGVDMEVASSRIDHVTIQLPTGAGGTTWVVVGSDSRAALPPGPNLYGTSADAPGSHADAVIVIHQTAAGTFVLSIPRDILVSPTPGVISRLTLTFDEGPQQLVDGLCRSLDIPTTHLVIITMKAFAAAVNALGGVTISNPAPVRDLYSGLDLAKVGPVHLDGVQVLALVRSRHPEMLTSKGWVAAGLTSGDHDRTDWIGGIFAALAAKAHNDRRDPFALQAVAWAVTSGLTTNSGTGLLDLFSLNLGSAHVVDLPVEYLGSDGIGATADPATTQALAAAGYDQTCH